LVWPHHVNSPQSLSLYSFPRACNCLLHGWMVLAFICFFFFNGKSIIHSSSPFHACLFVFVFVFQMFI